MLFVVVVVSSAKTTTSSTVYYSVIIVIIVIISLFISITTCLAVSLLAWWISDYMGRLADEVTGTGIQLVSSSINQ